MKIISVLSICSLLCACGIENIDKPNLCCSSDYMRPGDNVKDVEAMLDKCGQQKLKNMQGKVPPNAYMNQFFKMDFCMEDHGFRTSIGARQGCINYANYHSTPLPICVARGIYK